MGKVNEIIVAVDASAMAEEVLKRAIAVGRENRASLMVIHVIEIPFAEFPFGESIDEAKIQKKIESQIDSLNQEAQLEYSVMVMRGRPSETIAFEAKKIKADLVVIGSHGKEDIKSNYFGSTIRKIIQKTHTPVLVVKNRAEKAYKHIIAPTNLTDYSEKSVHFAKNLFGRASMKYLYAFESISELQTVYYHISEEESKRLREKMASNAKIEMEKFIGRVGAGESAAIDMTALINEDLLEYIIKDKADLVVLGSKGVDNLNSFVFGSTASYLSKMTPTDVLIYVPGAE